MKIGYTRELAEWNIDQTQRQLDGMSKISSSNESPSLRPEGTDGDEWSDNAWSSEDY